MLNNTKNFVNLENNLGKLDSLKETKYGFLNKITSICQSENQKKILGENDFFKLKNFFKNQFYDISDGLLEEILNEFPSGIFFVENDYGEILGALHSSLYNLQNSKETVNYIGVIGINQNYRGTGLGTNLIRSFIENNSKTDYIGLTTQNPAMYKSFKKATELEGYIFSGEKGDFDYDLGKNILESGLMKSDDLDSFGVRRNYLNTAFDSNNPIFKGFNYFEKKLSLNVNDGVLCIAKKKK